MTNKERKQVTVKGVTWTILSANERICSVCPGRYFFAVRCSSGSPWYLAEHDCDITKSSNGAKEIGYLPYRLMTGHLSLAVLEIAFKDEVLPTKDPATPLIFVTKPADAEYLHRIGATDTKVNKRPH